MTHRKQGIDILREGIALSEQDQFDEAIVKLNEVADTADEVCNALIQRGRAHWEMKRWGEAVRDFEFAHRMAPDNADLKWTMCLIHLQLNQFDKGWINFEDRWQSKKFDSPRLKTRVPKWTRTSTAKDILVWSEQGIGDQILYSSLLPEARQYVVDMTVMMDARLIPLYKRSMPSISFVPQNARVSEIDAQIAIGSLGAEFIRNMDDIPHFAARNYLKPDPERVEAVRKSLNKGKKDIIIGLSWRSGAPRIGNHKSVPIRELVELFYFKNVRVISLQYGDTTQEIEEFKQLNCHIEVLDIDMTHDFEGQAAAIACCDYVVSCSNATAHLAGALGAKVHLLDSNKLWFWNNRRGKDNLWYPNTKVYSRDNVVAPWTNKIEELYQDLDMDIEKRSMPIVFFHVGDDVTQPERLVKSIRQYMPHSDIIMCSDSATPEVDVDVRIDYDIDRQYIMTERVRAFSELSLNKAAIYVDSDMVFLDSVYLVPSSNRQAILCRRSFNRDHIFNEEQRGLSFTEYKGMTMDKVYPILACFSVAYPAFWTELLDMFQLMDKKYHVWYGDQQAMKVYQIMHKCETVDESIYACLPEHASQINRPKLLHYKGNRK